MVMEVELLIISITHDEGWERSGQEEVMCQKNSITC